MNWLTDWRLWLPVGTGLFLLFGHLTYSALCPIFASNSRARTVCVMSSSILIDLANAGAAVDATLVDAGVP